MRLSSCKKCFRVALIVSNGRNKPQLTLVLLPQKYLLNFSYRKVKFSECGSIRSCLNVILMQAKFVVQILNRDDKESKQRRRISLAEIYKVSDVDNFGNGSNIMIWNKRDRAGCGEWSGSNGYASVINESALRSGLSANDDSGYNCSVNDRSAFYRYKTASIDYSQICNRKRISEKSRRLEIQYCRRRRQAHKLSRETYNMSCHTDSYNMTIFNVALYDIHGIMDALLHVVKFYSPSVEMVFNIENGLAIRLPNLDTDRETTLKYTNMPEEDAKKNTGHHATRQNDKRNTAKTDEHY
ncbi:hypothetical protein ANN_27293 [Periplaneta americana]|uniref:Uncharacterized protein n=1 Tax=Periplaneta americana TaxID=6978 RepID=A0ABQ8RXQ0_PERAM|nr:hypothetical protein ANN_27293 [Periplaneta americana]